MTETHRVKVLEKALYEAIEALQSAFFVIKDLGDLDPVELNEERRRILKLKELLHKGCDESRPSDDLFCTKPHFLEKT